MKHQLRLAALVISALTVGSNVSAGPLLVTLDTSSLSGTQTVVFGLTNFDANSNSVVLSDFAFGGGSAVPATVDCTFGGAFSGLGCSGDLTTNVTLVDLDPTATFFLQQFDAGSALSFKLDATNNFTGPVPDQFSMFVCDATLTTCYSDDPSGALLLLDLTGGTISPTSFALFGAAGQRLPAPVVTFAPTAPEPGTLLLFAAAAGVAARCRKRGHTTKDTARRSAEGVLRNCAAVGRPKGPAL